MKVFSTQVTVDRRKQSVDLNPTRGEKCRLDYLNKKKSNKKRKRRDGSSSSSSSCFKRRRCQPLYKDNSFVTIPSGEMASDEEEGNCGIRRREDISDDNEVSSRVKYEHNEASLLSKCTFSWYVKLLWKGWKRPLEFSDLDKQVFFVLFHIRI